MSNQLKVLKREKEILLLLDEAHQIRINNLSKSISLTQRALEYSFQIGNKPLLARSLSQLGLYYMVIGEMDKAASFSKEALVIFTALNDEKGKTTKELFEQFKKK